VLLQGIMSCDPCSLCVQLVATTIFGRGERKFHCIFALGAKISGNESSTYGTFQERKYVGTKVLVTLVVHMYTVEIRAVTQFKSQNSL